MQSEKIIIEFVKKELYQKRKEYKHETWFALSNSIMENPDYCDLEPLEFKALIYLYCQCSKNKWRPTVINYRHAEKLYDIKRKQLDKVLAILLSNHKVIVHEPITNAPRTDHEPNRAATDNTDITDIKDITDNITSAEASVVSSESFDPDSLLNLWNENCGELPQAKALTDKRFKKAKARIDEEPNPTYWLDTIKRIAASAFCNNKASNSTGWTASFDFLLQPDTHIKVLEGKYDSRGRTVVHGADAFDFIPDDEVSA